MDRQLQAMVSIELARLMMGHVKLVSSIVTRMTQPEKISVGNEVPAFCRVLVGLVNAGLAQPLLSTSALSGK